MAIKLKKYETIGCCGIDCGLCPRFYTKGDSVCPGCGEASFAEKHPSCGFLTCCVTKKQLETCADCTDYPCRRFDSEKEGHDSFVTHKKIFSNLDLIKTKGIERFIATQGVRIEILTYLLSNFDDGRTKSFYCVCCALLPVDQLYQVQHYANSLDVGLELKEKSKLIKNCMIRIADSMSIDLKLKNAK
jgi:hypothetical protein